MGFAVAIAALLAASVAWLAVRAGANKRDVKGRARGASSFC